MDDGCVVVCNGKWPNVNFSVLISLLKVGNIDEDEEWKVMYVKENDPEAQVLEVPGLTPFTFYR